MKTYLVGENLPEKYKNTLKSHGRVVVLPRSAAVGAPTGTHPDTLIGPVGGTLFIPRGEAALKKALDGENIACRVTEKALGGGYPAECGLNFFTVGKYFVCKVDALAPEAIAAAKSAGYEIVDVRQGYAHCATAVVGGGAITADEGIYRALVSRGVPTLRIEAGNIDLPPYEYGFIGGASGMIDGGTVFFFGSLDTHPLGDKIRAFCAARGVKTLEGDGKLCDAGGFIALDT